MRFIIDRVLLNPALDSDARMTRLNLAGSAFLTVIVLNSLIGMLKDYRQRLLNVRVMLSLRRSLFDRLLHLPLPKLWDMKTATWTPLPASCRWPSCRPRSRSFA
jgi:ATP-binding cassette subfamily B protein/subfamily B ATP-binding cassette protein MsbA